MKKLLFAILLIGLPGLLVAQNKFTKIQGTLVDSTDAPLPLATVVLLQAADSVMYGFTTTSKEGVFEIGRIEAGDYILQASFMGYGSLSKLLKINTDQVLTNLGKFTLFEQQTMLDAVDITAEHIPILIKEDTIEYNASAFKTQPNAVVEDLLKRLPGVEVESDGTIRAQGEEVNKVLVDGKEFFGDDPKIATKNLPADAVNKVQVFDKMSEVAEFTGVDDGERDKTINLKLKDDKKNGLFGRISGGLGTEGTYEGRLNINNFTEKLQLSIIGNGNNVNKSSFSMGEYFSFMGGMSGMSMGGGGEMIMMSAGSQQNNGIMNTMSTGVNFNYDLTPKTELRSSYFFNRVDNLAISTTIRENFLDGSTFDSFESSRLNSLNDSHRVNLYLKHEFSKNADLIVRSNLGLGSGTFISDVTGETRNSNDQIENSSLRDQDSSGDNEKVDATVTYRQKFGRPGRSLVTEFKFNNTHDFKLLRLLSMYDLRPYDPNQSESTIIDQKQFSNNDQFNYGGRISFTEPVGKKQYLELSYSNHNYNTNLDKEFYDIEDVNEILNTDLSSIYNRDYGYHRGGLTYTLSRNKFNFNSGLTYQESVLKGKVEDFVPIRQKFNRVLPMLSAKYNFTTSKSIRLMYSTRLNEPSLEQLQPIPNNEDPLNVYIGNPDLLAQFTHNIGLSFHSFDQFSYISLFGRIGGTYTDNKITNSRTIDEFLRQTTTPVNVEYDKGINGYFSFGAPLKWMGTKINLSTNFNISRSFLFVNATKNLTDRNNNTITLRMDNRKKEKIDWSVGTRYSFNSTKYSVNTELDQRYLRESYFSDLNLYLRKWTLNTQFNYSIYSGAAFGEESAVPLWSAYVARSFLKSDRLELKLSVFDILNQNQGITRNAQLNYIEEVRYNALERYFMISATYNLSKFGNHRKGGLMDIKLH